MRYIKWIGLAACLVLVTSAFLPWTFHADIHKTFTGFYSEQNMYGRPGRFFITMGSISAILIGLDKIWAKRVQIFVAGILVAYAVKTYILFTSCYNAYCPEKQYGIYLMIFSSLVILIASIFPDMKLKTEN